MKIIYEMAEDMPKWRTLRVTVVEGGARYTAEQRAPVDAFKEHMEYLVMDVTAKMQRALEDD